MGEKALYLATIISILGLLILAFVSETLEPPVSEISRITTNDLGKNVHVQGTVKDVHKFQGGSKLIKLEDSTGVIDVYLPYNTAIQIDKLDGDVDVIGEVQVYKGRLEIVVDDLENIK